jgi:DNA polymerase/3'-5' exonuclease PolX
MWLRFLQDCSDRAATVGSYRRGVSKVKDLEYVVVPKLSPAPNLYGESWDEQFDETRACLEKAIPPPNRIKWGPRYRQFLADPVEHPGLKIDLFYAYPEAWGLTLAIRTGPHQFSRKLVTPRRHGGYLPGHLAVNAGRLWRRVDSETQLAGDQGTHWMRIDGEPYVVQPVEGERELFKLLEMPYVHVHEREKWA